MSIKALDRLREAIERDVNNPWSDLKGHLLILCHRVALEVEGRYTPLPLDADGTPIRLHDKMEAADGMTFPVKSIHFTSERGYDSWWVNEARFDPKELRHHHERTVEDVLRDCCNEWNKHAGNDWESGVYAKYAAKLRELMEVGE